MISILRMHSYVTYPIGFFVLVLCLLAGCSERTISIPEPPASAVVPITDSLHGIAVEDAYRWLENGQSRETREWIEAQNAYTDTILQQLPGRDQLHDLMKKLIKIDRIDRPIEAGGRYFYSRQKAGEDQPRLCVREGLNGKERVLVDPHTMSGDHSTTVELMDVTLDGKLISYAVRNGGADEAHIRFLDVASGRDLPEILPTGRYMSVEFSPDHGAVYYSRHGVAGPRLYLHRLRAGALVDRELFGGHLEPEKLMWSTLSEDGRWLLATVSDGAAGSIALHLADLTKGPIFNTLVDDGQSRTYGIFAGDELVFLTNRGAPRWRVMRARCANAAVENWTELIPEQKEAAIEAVEAVGGRLVVAMLRDAHYEAALYDLSGRKLRDIEFGAMGSIEGPSGRWSSNEVFFGFSSFHIPMHIYHYDIDSGESTVWFRTEVPVDTEDFTVSRMRYSSADGTRIPMFLVHRKDLERNGEAPVLLFGYGGFGSQVTPWFSALGASIVNAGGIFAVPNLRGGGEFGEDWHHAGMLENKQNVFDDFIAAAEFLIAEKFSRPEHIAIYGSSNGGLLVAACMTQRPELFGAVICTYPVLDMLRYQHFLVGSFWIPEYGSSGDPDQFGYLKAYSPYHNVTKGTVFPATMLITGDEDTRVDPLHARKMTALLQASNAGTAPILLRYHTHGGHSGSQPRSKIIAELVDTFSFLSWRTGLSLE